MSQPPPDSRQELIQRGSVRQGSVSAGTLQVLEEGENQVFVPSVVLHLCWCNPSELLQYCKILMQKTPSF